MWRKRRLEIFAALAAVPLVLGPLSGCNNTPKRAVAEVDNQHQRLAISGIEKLRQALNAGECESIYDAAIDDFRRSEEKQDWLTKCGRIRDKWGRWDAFTAAYWYKPDDIAVAVEGRAAFQKGDCSIHVVWILDHERVRLRWLFLNAGSAQIEAPPLPTPLHFDPRRQDITPVA